VVTVVIAELVGEYLITDSIMTEKLTRRGLRVRHIYEFNPLRQIRVSSIMSPLIGVNGGERVMDVLKLVNQPDHEFAKKKRLAVLKDGIAVGVVDRSRLYEEASKADPEITVMQVASKNFHTINEDEFGFEALRIMTLNDAPFLIALDKNGRAVGYVSRGDMIKSQKAKIMDDTMIEKGILARILRRSQ
jgi:CBS domain-containing protein